MENYVNIEQTQKIIYKGPLEISTMKDGGIFLEIIKSASLYDGKSFSKIIKSESSYDSMSVFPIYDSSGRKIGGIFVLSNLDEIHNNFVRSITIIPSVFLFVFILIGITNFLIIQKINKDLIKAKIEADESAKRASMADKTKSDFLANMSHEIRTPMNAIMGFSEILRDELENTKHVNYIDTIITSSKTLLSLINDILDLSKIEAGKMEFQYRPTDPHALFSDIAKIFSIKLKEKGLKFITDIDENLPKAVLLDEVRMRQILFNLVGNAVKFTSEGYIELKVKGNYYSDRSRIDLVFSVKDTGVGISEEDKKIVFNAFQQSSGQSIKKYGGTGLGLAITKKLVELMNGEISVDSIVGKGSIFKVIIKEVSIASIDKSIEEKKAYIENIKFLNQKVLVVDDIESNRLLLQEILVIYGLRFFEATNGKEAINLASFEHPDIILMDLRMPVMDGYEAIKILKSDPDLKNIPVIILTASAMKFNEEEIKKLNCEGYIRKPISREELITEFKKYLKYSEEVETKVKDSTKSIKDASFKNIDIEKLKEKFPEILIKLQGEILSKLSNLKRELILNDIEDFAKEIIIMGEYCELPMLVSWGKKISTHTSNFDLDNLSKALDSFEDKLNEL
jgi:signal transduction histidine kinase/CheY-like chemotaxis protein